MRQDSCLSTLYFEKTIDDKQICETEKVFLPMREQKLNLGYRVSLLLSSNEGYPLIELYILKSENPGVRKWRGSRVGIIPLE